MDNPIRQATVIGAGSMGSGIAALLASNGVQVLLLDVPDGSDRDARARRGLELQLKRGGFTHPDFADNVTVGNTEDDFERIADSQWVIEAVFENLEVKRDVYARLEAVLSADAVLSSNTSTIPLAQLSEQMGESMARRFVITHFFNPPRVMNLVEVVSGKRTDAGVVEHISEVITHQLGKVALPCRDTPGFLANRVGNLWMAAAAILAFEQDISPELADAINQRIFTTPRTGVFGLFDYIGLQLVPDVWGSFLTKVDEFDAYRRFRVDNHPLFTGLIERGLTGRTGESGIYKGREQVIDPESMTYRDRRPVEDAALMAADTAGVVDADSPGGRYARAVFLEVVRYCASIAPEIADNVDDIDQSMIHGYSWKQGPFALADGVGLDGVISRMEADGIEVPEFLRTAAAAGGFYPAAGKCLSTTGQVVDRPSTTGQQTIAALAAECGVGEKNDDAQLIVLPDGTGIFSALTKRGSMSPAVFELLDRVCADGNPLGLRALVLASDDPRAFCAGADLGTLAQAGADGDEARLREFIDTGARVFARMRQAEFPVVAAVRGFALGGGLELLLHTDAAVFHQDCVVGFPERSVGLFPGWSGPLRAAQRIRAHLDESPDRDARALAKAFALSLETTPMKGAYALSAAGLLGEHDQVIALGAGVLDQAIVVARELARDYVAPAAAEFVAYKVGAGQPGLAEQWLESADGADEVDGRIAHALAQLLEAGADTSAAGGILSEATYLQRNCALCAPLLCQPGHAERAAAVLSGAGRKRR
ncbi:hypothetical protein CAQU_03650 [Corynebacterium aquilae DSM 44791]|uniref:enoyl-CoA hydratase n=1 Tax=Corynebacterium aquilae DSM 44791 TaxID=1431546 RepID=A0A1L7CEL3_9CORY|nr:hypothetical protein CAQU_03650 [Corynebacterium aquilae DSM 44791]